MKALLISCASLLLLALIDLPIGYYTFLRIVVTIGAIAVVITEFENGVNFWVLAFGLVAVLFNPIIPVYLGDKAIWMPIDIITAILFGIKSIMNQQQQKQ
ncbi:MAG TPA: hypothetical protein DEA82_13305 [Flavobacteriaceae bacterium]|nr:hypothetical protein [Flavobacteriaceae bacterium]HBR55097.1 hypothetical protein [Flavobacteriaceae bacterium]|tara:strand:- start:167 stop:466 length:300 start_codon:yes stop_codon:yes gene_type:complete